MKKENLAFLFGGFAFGVLVGVGLFSAFNSAPGAPAAGMGAPAAALAPAGPMAPTQAGGGGGAPMVPEINALKRRLQENPGDVESAARLANIFHDAQMWDQAAMYYEMTVKLRPNDADVLTDLGICYRAMQRFDDALDSFTKARSVSPDHWQSLFNTAVVAAFDLGDHDRALEALRPLEGLKPIPPQVTELKKAVVHAKEQLAGTPGS